MSRAAAADHDVAYLTDVEGKWPRLKTFVDGNPLVSFDATGRLVVRPGATFVFGGDAIDRGPESRRIVRTLLDAKRRQPEQVVLLAGNRDLNKLRLPWELDGHPPRRAPDEARGWPRPVLLRWIFTHSMGAGEAFAHRAEELAAEGLPTSDEDIVESWLDDLRPGGGPERGTLAQYLSVCQLAFRAGHTLFVHGGIAEEALANVPGHPPDDLARFDVDRWIARLNRFYDEQIAAFLARAKTAQGGPAWEPLIAYQAPRRGLKANPGSVVYGRMGDALNNPALPPADARAALLRAGVRRLVVGHTPNGDVPSIVRDTGGAPFEVVIADNSRSRVDLGTQLVVRDAGIRYAGEVVLDDGGRHRVALELDFEARASPIGRRTADGALVKAPLSDGRFTLFRLEPGYRVRQHALPADALGPLTDPTL